MQGQQMVRYRHVQEQSMKRLRQVNIGYAIKKRARRCNSRLSRIAGVPKKHLSRILTMDAAALHEQVSGLAYLIDMLPPSAEASEAISDYIDSELMPLISLADQRLPAPAAAAPAAAAPARADSSMARAGAALAEEGPLAPASGQASSSNADADASDAVEDTGALAVGTRCWFDDRGTRPLLVKVIDVYYDDKSPDHTPYYTISLPDGTRRHLARQFLVKCAEEEEEEGAGEGEEEGHVAAPRKKVKCNKCGGTKQASGSKCLKPCPGGSRPPL